MCSSLKCLDPRLRVVGGMLSHRVLHLSRWRCSTGSNTRGLLLRRLLVC